MTKLLRIVSMTFAMVIMCVACYAKDFCFIGDSRFVGMKDSMRASDNISWVARVSAGNGLYNENIDKISGLDRNTTIVYGLGVNDLDGRACVRNLQNLVNMGFNNVYFVSVTPVDEAKEAQYGYSRTNNEIKEYNSFVMATLPEKVNYIDSYNYILANGFDTEDGLHYSANTYRVWFGDIMNKIY